MERAPVRAPLIKNLELKVGVLLAVTALITLGFIGYLLHARGVFEASQSLTLTADNADGVSIGMPVTFSGFPIGQVQRMTLTDSGQVHLAVDIPEKNLRWLRATSVFTLEKPIVGAAKIKAYSANLKDPPLPANAERELFTGDTAQEIPVLVARLKGILENVEAMTKAGSSINQSLANVSTLTQRMTGEYGVMQGLLGGPENARKVVDSIDRANTLLKSLNGVSLRVDSTLAKADQRLFGQEGVMDEAQRAVKQVNGILGDARESLKKANAILANAQGISADVKGATTDLGTLRAEVDDSLVKVNHLINEVNRKWPFARDAEIKLP
jgi:phospholipid/cholesterol/gamma-HCH transport system substrate-binding protein